MGDSFKKKQGTCTSIDEICGKFLIQFNYFRGIYREYCVANRMKKFFRTAPPGTLLIGGLLLMCLAMGLHAVRGEDVQLLNILFFITGLFVYYLPVYLRGNDQAEGLRRKLLWMLLAAGLLVLVFEIVKFSW